MMINQNFPGFKNYFNLKSNKFNINNPLFTNITYWIIKHFFK
jgi:hypothetical protein